MLFIAILFAVTFSELSGFNLECEFSDGPRFVGWDYTVNKRCEAKNLNIKSANQSITTINGQTADFYHTYNVKSFKVELQVMNYIPQGLSMFFPMLEELYISSSQLKSLTKMDLQPFKNLKVFLSEHNELEELSSDLFEFNDQIESLYFYDEKLRYIGDGILDSLNELGKVFFPNNICIDKYADSKSMIAEIKDEIKTKCAKPSK